MAFDAERHAGELVELAEGTPVKRWNGSDFTLEQETKVRVVGLDPREPEHVLVLSEEDGLLEGVDEQVLWQLQNGDQLYITPDVLGALLQELPELKATPRGRVSDLAERCRSGPAS